MLTRVILMAIPFVASQFVFNPNANSQTDRFHCWITRAQLAETSSGSFVVTAATKYANVEYGSEQKLAIDFINVDTEEAPPYSGTLAGGGEMVPWWAGGISGMANFSFVEFYETDIIDNVTLWDAIVLAGGATKIL